MNSRYSNNDDFCLAPNGTCEVDEALCDSDSAFWCKDSFVGAQVSASCVSSDDDHVTACPVEEGAARYEFINNVKNWRDETGILSTNNLTNTYFNNIVDMGQDAVPFILEELKKGPTQLVHALDLIYPGKVSYRGAVSLKKACDAWMKVLQA